MMPVYLAASEYIDWVHPSVQQQAARCAEGAADSQAIAQRCFEWVRDNIQHSMDYQMNPVTCKASDVLQHKTGYCYAKSHLLAALLRANQIPAGLCYQRLSVDDQGAPYCLHGLNALWLQGIGWYRVDARGNKPGVQADFDPPREQLAFHLQVAQERDFPEIWPEPLPCVVETLTTHKTFQAVYQNLPDIEVASIAS